MEKGFFKKYNNSIFWFLFVNKECKIYTKDEIRILKALSDTYDEYNFGAYTTNPFGKYNEMSLFKIEDGSWITWKNGNLRNFCNAKKYNDVYEAGMGIINDYYIRLNNTIKHTEKNDNSILLYFTKTTSLFDQNIESGYCTEELEEYARSNNFNMKKDNVKILQKK